ncbi:hypothetical protein Dimus_011076 [Dionaea muscipula]
MPLPRRPPTMADHQHAFTIDQQPTIDSPPSSTTMEGAAIVAVAATIPPSPPRHATSSSMASPPSSPTTTAQLSSSPRTKVAKPNDLRSLARRRQQPNNGSGSSRRLVGKMGGWREQLKPSMVSTEWVASMSTDGGGRWQRHEAARRRQGCAVKKLQIWLGSPCRASVVKMTALASSDLSVLNKTLRQSSSSAAGDMEIQARSEVSSQHTTTAADQPHATAAIGAHASHPFRRHH